MQTAIELGCRCSKVKGRLLSAQCLHLRCWCNCCQTFAKWMEAREVGSTRDCVNKTHGTEVFQFFRDQVCLDTGQEFVIGTKLTTKTITVRYISTCCNTPLFITPDFPSFVPIIDVFASFIVDKANTQPFNGPVEYQVFALQAARESEDRTMTRNGLHYKFLLHTLARTLKGVVLLK